MPLPTTLPTEPDDAGNRDRHAGTDATGTNPDVSSPQTVPTRLSAWRSFPRRRRQRKPRPVEEGSADSIYKAHFRQNPLRGNAENFLYSVPAPWPGDEI